MLYVVGTEHESNAETWRGSWKIGGDEQRVREYPKEGKAS